jgi:hypothetical protein
VGGVVLGASLVTRSAALIVGAVILLIVAFVVLFAYTYLWWRDDPDRIAAPEPR